MEATAPLYLNFFIMILIVAVTSTFIAYKGAKQRPKKPVRDPLEQAEEFVASNVVHLSHLTRDLTKLAIRRAILQEKGEDTVEQTLELLRLDRELLQQGRDILANRELD
ncbi:hypothetical protein [Algicola sagamiensis]|uniref:hypothetical protein n=1 Tax=Algicola sagamiensis TaxID=163869 RepID=UPI000365D1A3|nr:hypothetical protein [Algicola sagamiensis]